MKISTKGRYSLIFLIDLAEHSDEGSIALNDVASRKNISKKYLEQIVPILNKAGVLKSNRGSKGGYSLSVAPSKITVGSILRVTENSLMEDTDAAAADSEDDILTLFVWQGLNETINNYLDNITIQDIIDKQNDYYSDTYII